MDRRIVRICRAGDQLPRTRDIYQLWTTSVHPPQRARPLKLTLEDVQTDATEFVDVRVVYLGEESDLRRSHRVVVGEEELQIEYAA